MNYENLNTILKEEWRISDNGRQIIVGSYGRFGTGFAICDLKKTPINPDHTLYISKIIRASKDLYETSRSILYEFQNMKGQIKDPSILHLITQLRTIVDEIKK